MAILQLMNTNFTVLLWAYSTQNAYGRYDIIGRKFGWNLHQSLNKLGSYVGGSLTEYTTAEDFLYNQWAYIGMTHDNETGETSYWVNGERDNTNFSTDAVTAIASTYGMVIGIDTYDESGMRFKGYIDEIRIWNRTLTDDEVEQQYFSNLHKINTTDWGLYVNNSLAMGGNYTFKVYASNTTGSSNETEERLVNVSDSSWPRDQVPNASICRLKDCKRGILIMSSDANNYGLYTAMYNATEANGDYIVTADIDTNCYANNVDCSVPPNPSVIELREMMWAGHCLDFDGWTHIADICAFELNANNDERIGNVTDAYLWGRDAFYYNVSGTVVITAFMPWSADHRNKNHGQIGFETAKYVYIGQRLLGGYFYDELVIPKASSAYYIEFGSNSRGDLEDLYFMAQYNYDAGRNYTHVWGHGSAMDYDDITAQMALVDANSTIKDYYWSASLERAARYIIERDNTNITEINLTSNPKQISLNVSYPSTINLTMYGTDIYVMPLTINITNSSNYTFVYENVSGKLTRLYSYNDSDHLYFEAIPQNQTILMSDVSLQTADKPLVNLTINTHFVQDPVGNITRAGQAYEVIVSGYSNNSNLMNWSLSILNSSNLSYTNWLNRNISDYERPLNDRLNAERGIIIYHIEQGYTNDSLFTFKGNLTNVDGESRYLSLGNINNSISVGMRDNVTINITSLSENLTQNISFEVSSFGVNTTYTVYALNSSNIMLNSAQYTADPNGTIAFSTALTGVATLTINESKAENASCSEDIECLSNYCVHSVCRPSDPYCGDDACDAGESCSSCSADCGICPTITTLVLPTNNTNNSNTTITFSYNVTNEAGVANCSLVLDGATNQTNASITVNITQNFILANMVAAGYNWSVQCISEQSDTNVSAVWWLTVKYADAHSCSQNSDCSSSYCVHSVCRASSTYCGDSYCDTGESHSTCSADCTETRSTRGTAERSATETKSAIFTSVEKNQELVFVPLSDLIYVKEVVAIAAESSDYARMTIENHNSQPSSVSRPAGKLVYQYLDISTDIKIKQAEIEFEVPDNWLAENNVDEADVVLLHYGGNNWKELETQHISGNRYKAVTDGFSVFAISIRESVAVVVSEPELVEDTEPEITGLRSSSLSLLGTIILILALLVVGVLYKAEYTDIRRKRKNKIRRKSKIIWFK